MAVLALCQFASFIRKPRARRGSPLLGVRLAPHGIDCCYESESRGGHAEKQPMWFGAAKRLFFSELNGAPSAGEGRAERPLALAG